MFRRAARTGRFGWGLARRWRCYASFCLACQCTRSGGGLPRLRLSCWLPSLLRLAAEAVVAAVVEAVEIRELPRATIPSLLPELVGRLRRRLHLRLLFNSFV